MGKFNEGEFINVLIKPDGSVDVEMEGFKGQGCAEAAAALIKKLGKTAQKKKLPEYYQEEKQQECARKKA